MPESGKEVYLREIEAVLPRLLALYDRDPASPTLGFGDRLHWGWKLIDFPNATSQGAAHGLSRLLAAGLLPQYLSRNAMLERIDHMICAVGRIMAPDGSLAEAFPRESSFCVTALIAYDILCAVEALAPHTDAATISRWKGVAAPLVAFLIRNDETHAVISNHLATAVAALLRWEGDDQEKARRRAKALLGTILSHQSAEGWFCEYGTLDPGYETLGLTYLADVHARDRDLGLAPHLERSLALLTYFAHPDGSFGGLYGGRNTRFIVPGGIEELAGEFRAARALSVFTRSAIGAQTIVTLRTLDEGNLAPAFNAYCRAATVPAMPISDQDAALPWAEASAARRHLPEAGLLIDYGPEHYTVVSFAKGGVVQHYPKDGHTRAIINPGALARSGTRYFTTQAQRHDNRVEIQGDRITVEAPFVEAKSERPTPFKFVILRVLSLTLFRNRSFLEWVKRLLVQRLITGQIPSRVRNRRTIRLGPDLKIEDQMLGDGLEPVTTTAPFSAIHMASAGYWQRQDDAS